MRSLASAAAHSSVVIYSIDARGLMVSLADGNSPTHRVPVFTYLNNYPNFSRGSRGQPLFANKRPVKR